MVVSVGNRISLASPPWKKALSAYLVTAG